MGVKAAFAHCCRSNGARARSSVAELTNFSAGAFPLTPFSGRSLLVEDEHCDALKSAERASSAGPSALPRQPSNDRDQW
jgi:hypothetical protein